MELDECLVFSPQEGNEAFLLATSSTVALGLHPEVYPQEVRSGGRGSPIVVAPLTPAVCTLCGAEAQGMAPCLPAGPPSAVEVVRSPD
ncbi:hypothetical protein NQZ68_023187 [Dissostichus eleginoides]|nr:hypothetical protein NQZ68_023187 [Dissostichus eleginoides]